MKKNPYQNETKAIKLLQDRNESISKEHEGISKDFDDIKARLEKLGVKKQDDFEQQKQKELDKLNRKRELEDYSIDYIYEKANRKYKGDLTFNDILSSNDRIFIENKIDNYIDDFNKKYALDKWDYAIAVGCGLFASMLDILFVKKPPKPTVPYSQKVDGIFNQYVQNAFNSFLPPDISKELSRQHTIGSADISTIGDILDAPKKLINPRNHRLKELSHDPILGFIFGVYDMMNGTCTIIHDGSITSYKTTKAPMGGSIYQNLGKMLGHLMSDVNAPSANMNRGMGLPAPFMGLLTMFKDIPFGDSNFGKQIEYMYANGYDFRQFVVSSIPVSIMEIMLRVFYVLKQVKVNKQPFGETMLDTMPLKINPRFRIILALAYGSFSAVNAGKVYITKDILNANYAAWGGFAWNTFFALKWSLLDKHLKLWGNIEKKEIEELEETVSKIEQLGSRAEVLPI